MKCPICQKDMEFLHKQFTYSDDRKEYLSQTYHCAQDDVWIQIEKPAGDQRKLT